VLEPEAILQEEPTVPEKKKKKPAKASKQKVSSSFLILTDH